MGYSEVLCHICGVSFNIGRIRRPDEPRTTAWSRFGGGWVDGARSSWTGECQQNDGCMIVRRALQSVWDFQNPSQGFVPDASSDGSDYQPDSSESDETLEWTSDDDSTHTSDANIPHVEDGGAADLRHDIQSFWRRTAATRLEPQRKDESLMPLFTFQFVAEASTEGVVERDNITRSSVTSSGASGLREHDLGQPSHSRYPLLTYNDKEERHVEHIAGPSCRNNCGYSGHEIDVEEMRGCQTLQCLVRKHDSWQPEDDDEEFERNVDWFSSGLSDHMPSRDYSFPRTRPERHGISSPHAENCFWQVEEAHNYAMPFHPSCLEVYKRASKLRQGFVDIEGVTGWWQMEADYELFHSFPRDEAVQRGRSQEWEHHPGGSFLAANPLFVLALDELLRSAVQEDPTFSVRNGAFSVQQTHNSGCSDPFAKLPDELRMHVLSYLQSSSIAQLRVASRSFAQLPISLWYDLLRREIPSLWEIWSDIPYAYWATVTSTQADASEKAFQEQKQIQHDALQVLKEEMPEVYENVSQQWTKPERCRKPVKPMRLPYAQTNWYQLYTDITRDWAKLKGLKNRERIWRDCEEILRRVNQYRFNDQIPVRDIRSVVQASIDRQIARNQAWNERCAREREERERREVMKKADEA